MTAYYNENEPYCAAWLRNLIGAGLIAPGDVDERSIAEVSPDDLKGYGQCHFFAGLGGWSRALRLADWPDDRSVWTGSCPCQPFSGAGKRGGFADERHLWPVWFKLIAERRPPVVFGEQVARAADWLALVRSDLETVGYAVGAVPIEAASVGANHKRDRFWFVADADSGGKHVLTVHAEVAEPSQFMANADRSARRREAGNANAGASREAIRPGQAQPRRRGANVANAGGQGLQTPECDLLQGPGRRPERRTAPQCGWWSSEPDVGRVAHGIPARVAKLRALGNAIVPQVAAEFIGAYVDARSCGLNVGK